MSDFHFLRPWWLAGLALILAWPLLRHWFEQSGGWSRVLAPHLLKPLTGEKHNKARRWPLFVCLSMWSLLCVSLAGPAWERLPMPVFEQERGIVLVMDMSMNTRASDITPDRLSRLRYKAMDILDEVDGAQVGIIAYAGDAFSISPLTYDFSNIRTMVPALSPEIMPVAGNYPLLAMQEAHRMLTDSGVRQGEIIWLSAGMTRDDYQEINAFLRGKSHRLSALIAGTDDHAPIRLADGNIMRDSMGRIEMAHINPNDFARLTSAHNGVSVRLRADDEDIQQILALGSQDSSLTEADDHLTADEWLDRGPYLAWLLIPLVLLLTRRGVLMSTCLLPFIWTLAPSTAYAANQSTPSGNWQLPFKNANQRAEQLYRQGNYEQAASLFNDPRRQGDAWYRAGDYEQALSAYQRAPDNADTWFNRGNAFAQTGQYAAAEDAYAQALQERPDWSEALENKALMEQLQEQEQEQQQGDGDEESDSSQPDDAQEEGADDSAQDDQQSDEQGSDTGDQGAESDDHSEQSSDDTDGANDEQESEQEQSAEDMSQTDSTDEEQLSAESIQSALMNEDLTDEEREELEQLLRRVSNDPAQLLRNRMRLEAEQRRHSQPPRTQSPRGAR